MDGRKEGREGDGLFEIGLTWNTLRTRCTVAWGEGAREREREGGGRGREATGTFACLLVCLFDGKKGVEWSYQQRA
jgi:hypothetical protein